MSRILFAAIFLASAAGAAPEPRPVKVENLTEPVFGAVSHVGDCGARATCLLLDGRTLYCGANRALWVFDVTDPLKPRLRSVAKGIGNPRQIAAENGMVYVAARETGVWIVDATDPDAAKTVNRFDTVELATGMDVCGGVLFVGQRQNGVEFVDVRDPLRPAHIRIEKTSESQSVWYEDGWLYSGDWGAGEITTIDAHDMATVRTVNLAPLKGHGDGVAVAGNRLYAATGHHYHDKTKSAKENFGAGHGLEVFDRSDPAHPKFLCRVQFPRFYTLGGDWWTPRPSADGKTVYVADTHNGLFAVDVADTAVPRILGRLTLPETKTKDDRPSAIVNYVAVGDGVVYMASEGGLDVIASPRAKAVARVRGCAPRNPGFRMSYPTPANSRFAAWTPQRSGQLRGAAVQGDFCYAACGHAGLAILKWDESGGPAAAPVRQVGALDAAFVGDAKVKDGLLYVAEGLDGLAVYALEDPAKPRLVRRVKDFGGRTCCAIWVWTPNAPYVVVSNRQNGYLFLDKRKDLAFVYASDGGCPGWDRYLANDVVGGNWLAQSTSNTGFKWLDLGCDVPVEVVRCRGYNKAGLNDGCIAFKDGKLLRMMGGGYALLDPGQKPNADGSDWQPVRFVGAKHALSGQPVWDGSRKLALSIRIHKIVHMCDVYDAERPRVVWTEKVVGHPDTALFWKNRLVIPCGYQGLLVEKSGKNGN